MPTNTVSEVNAEWCNSFTGQTHWLPLSRRHIRVDDLHINASTDKLQT